MGLLLCRAACVLIWTVWLMEDPLSAAGLWSVSLSPPHPTSPHLVSSDLVLSPTDLAAPTHSQSPSQAPGPEAWEHQVTAPTAHHACSLNPSLDGVPEGGGGVSSSPQLSVGLQIYQAILALSIHVFSYIFSTCCVPGHCSELKNKRTKGRMNQVPMNHSTMAKSLLWG